MEKTDNGKDWGQEDNGVTKDEMLDSIIDSIDMNLSKFRVILEDRWAWQATVHGVTKSRTWLSDWTTATTQVIYKAVLVSAVQQSELGIQIIYPLCFRFFSHIGHQKVFSRVTCAIYNRPLLVIYFIYSNVYISIPISQCISCPHSFPPLITISLFSTSRAVLLFWR